MLYILIKLNYQQIKSKSIMKMKRNNAKSAVAAFAVACALVMNVTPMAAGKGGLIPKIWELITGEPSGIPCWSSYDNPSGCCHKFTRCSGCVTISGIPDGPQGTC